MPELAAHLERVARELVEAAEHTNKWTFVAPVRRQLIGSVAAALAACAREEALEWDKTAQLHISRWTELEWRNKRLAALERAVGGVFSRPCAGPK